MTIFSYVVARDYGFAPNPFFGYCTLACCKSEVRGFANVGDWIVGTGSATRDRVGFLVYAMKVSETLSFDEYWLDPRFLHKRPDTGGSRKVAYGDNIYCSNEGIWHQQDSHHSFADGVQNEKNITTDTKVDRVLIGTEFKYWGEEAPKIPAHLRNFQGGDICINRGYKSKFSLDFVKAFEEWYFSLAGEGFMGRPSSW